jgi:hypothetical protein
LPKQDLDFSCEEAKLGYIISFLPTAIEIYRKMPEPTQIEQFSHTLDLIYHRIASRSSNPLSVN